MTNKVEIIVGTTLGGAEYVADELTSVLEQQGYQVTSHLDPALDELDKSAWWLVVSSTHGAGDLPDNLQPFYQSLLATDSDLSAVSFAVCAIGDSSYDTFCLGPAKLTEALEQHQAKQLTAKIQIDVQYDPVPEDPAIQWLESWIQPAQA
ncbi:FMN-binding protein MioC [Shewanella sp. A3A]|uniref:FMN-binding protein MioC n=1 Tax=Shewanella electrica TaxID=515560 RepID=A0ABT2FQJ2_9GAMM|nr:FMN-binding protein MioC [Shewanella electrica]MCH1921134.1 FMN-binding protein MioC [Shewanella ferrihydritica]MCH1926576.1 FMN-binding protein MioC [Shewanella electrica]MCS4558197.1 FMN-binding protein MioC [Shewanella electrica]